MRKRLTAKTLLSAFDDKVDEINLPKKGQPVKDCGNYDWQPGYDTPVESKIDDKVDEINLPVKTAMENYRTAKRSVQLASLVLGEDADENDIKEQAKDFSKMGYARVCASLKRCMAAIEAEECEDGECENKEEAPAEECPECENEETPAAPVEACKAAEEPAAEESADDLVADAPAEEASEEEPEMQLDIPAAPAEDEDGFFNSDTELNQSAADPELEAMFGGQEVKPVETSVKTAGKKAGISHLPGQPKLASTDTYGVSELEGIWTGLKVPGL